MTTPFPPRDASDIAAYDGDEVLMGYRDYCPDDPEPGANRSPSYRWGWANGRKDGTRVPDGFEHLRRAYVKEARP